MYYLNDEQINLIRKEVDRQDIHFRHLAYDLTDHICCEIEDLINRGKKFQDAFNEVLGMIGNDGLQQIQKDTLFLTDKKYRNMKNSMKITGVASMALLSIGALLKIEHFPGANLLFILGFLLLGVIYFPVSMFVLRKENEQIERPIIYIAAFVGGFALIVGIFLKVVHWPGASPALILGYGTLGLIFLPMLLIRLLKSTTDKALKNIYSIGVAALFLCLAGSCGKFNHYPGSYAMLVSGSIGLTTIFFPLYVFKEFKGFKSVEPRFIFLCIGMIYYNMFNLLLAYH